MSTRNRSGYLPSLDGWRCIAILGVLWAHDDRAGSLLGPAITRFQSAGGFGVPLFYAISGFLIAWRILQEEPRSGGFNVRAFYVRRFFRIQPPQWTYLAVIAVLMLLGAVHVTWKYWLGALFLYENFLWHNFVGAASVIGGSFLFGHFWTLAVEEHFYLVISLFFVLIKRRRGSVLALGILALVTLQHWAQHHGLFSADVSTRRTYWNIQWLLFASWTAICLQARPVLEFARRWLRPWVAFLATAAILYAHELYTYGRQRPDLYNLLYRNAETLFFCFTGWIVATMLHPGSLSTRFLELAPLRFLGRISYSLYIWHVVFFLLDTPAACSWPWLVTLNGTPWRYLCTLAAALLSFYGVERPMIRLGHRLAQPGTAGHADLKTEAPPRALPVSHV